MLSHLGRASVAALLLVVSISCGGGSSTSPPGTFTVARLQQSQARTEAELIAELGPGEVVENDYTKGLITDHKLPESVRFRRWEDPDQPGVYHHVAVVDGKLLPKRFIWDSRPKQ